MSETLLIDEWIRNILVGIPAVNTATGGRMYPDQAPQGTSFPVVIYSLQSTHDVMGQGTFRIMTKCNYQIKVIGQTRSYWDIKPIYDAIDTALHGIGSDTVNAHIFACMRWEEFRLAEFTEGKEYRHLGGLYDILVQRIV
jgi:hypothetical protein